MADIHDASYQSEYTTQNDAADSVSLMLVGGRKIVCQALESMFSQQQISVLQVFADEQELAEHLEHNDCDADVILLVLSGGPFATFHRIRETLQQMQEEFPLVVLSDQASRGQVYAALRTGAKAYVNLDDNPDELFKAIRMAATNRVYLAPDAAELLVNDISTSYDATGKTKLPSIELSKREIEIVQLLCEGLSSKEIARRLHISSKTVENHRYNIYRKCEVDGIAGLMRHAIQQGLITI
ncbi:MAG: DNA-binding response regulator [Phycisphaerae bacterium]